jgi:hypothetical protein
MNRSIEGRQVQSERWTRLSAHRSQDGLQATAQEYPHLEETKRSDIPHLPGDFYE